MIDLSSVVVFFHKAEWTELTVTHEINRVLRENRIAYSTVGKYVREFICESKEKYCFIIRQFEGDSTETTQKFRYFTLGVTFSIGRSFIIVYTSKSSKIIQITQKYRYFTSSVTFSIGR
jgi:predicted metal-dependent RNase